MDESSEGDRLPDFQKPSCSTWKNGLPIADNVDKHWESLQSIGSQELDSMMFCDHYAPTTTLVANDRLRQANLKFSNRRPTTQSHDDNDKDSAAEDKRKCQFIKFVELTPGTSAVISYMVDDKERTFCIKANPPSSNKGTMRMDHAYVTQLESVPEAESSSSDDPPSQPEENLWIHPNSPRTYSKERQANSPQRVIQDVRTLRSTQFEQVTTTSERDCEIDARNHLVASAPPNTEQENVGLRSLSPSMATPSSSRIPDDLILEETPPSRVPVTRKVVVSSLNDKLTNNIPVRNSEKHRSESAAAPERRTNSSVSGGILVSSMDSLPCHEPLKTTAPAAAAKSSSVMMSCNELYADICPASVESMDSDTTSIRASSPEVLIQSKRRRVDASDLVKSKENSPVSHIAGSKKDDAVVGLTPVSLLCAPVLDNAKRDQLLSVQFPTDTMDIMWQFLCKKEL